MKKQNMEHHRKCAYQIILILRKFLSIIETFFFLTPWPVSQPDPMSASQTLHKHRPELKKINRVSWIENLDADPCIVDHSKDPLLPCWQVVLNEMERHSYLIDDIVFAFILRWKWKSTDTMDQLVRLLIWKYVTQVLQSHTCSSCRTSMLTRRRWLLAW